MSARAWDTISHQAGKLPSMGATALQLTYNRKLFFLISAAAGVGACLSGLLLSHLLDLPSGASVVLRRQRSLSLPQSYLQNVVWENKNRGNCMHPTPEEIYRTRKLYCHNTDKSCRNVRHICGKRQASRGNSYSCQPGRKDDEQNQQDI
jgi:hypothetical protein